MRSRVGGVALMLWALLWSALVRAEDLAHVREVRWDVIQVPSQARGVLKLAPGREADVRLVTLPEDVTVRALCPPGVAPLRLRVEEGAVVEGPWSRPIEGEAGLYFAPGPGGELRTWAFEAPGCQLEQRRVTTTTAGLARLERGARTLEALRGRVTTAAPFDPELQRWLDAAEGAERWGHRYLALRPPSGRGMGGVPAPPTEGTPVEIEGAPTGAGSVGWRAEGPLRWELRGPARVRIEARPLGRTPHLCLSAGEMTDCRASTPAAVTLLRDGHLTEEPLRVGGEHAQRLIVWYVLLPEGRHAVSLSGPAVATASWSAPEGVSPALRGLPTSLTWVSAARPAPWVSTAAPPQGEAPLRWEGLDLGSDAGVVRMATALQPGAPVDPRDARWIDLTSPGALEGLEPSAWMDERHRVQLWIPDVGATCRVELAPGAQFTARIDAPLQTFIWTGVQQAPLTPPRVQGCRAWLRTTGWTRPVWDEGAIVVAPYHLLGGGTSRALALDPERPARLSVALPPGAQGEVHLEVRTDGAGWERFTVRPAVAEASPHLRPWVLWSRQGLSRVELRADAPVYVRLQQARRGSPPMDSSYQEHTDGSIDSMSLEALRALSLQVASQEQGRAAALRERARWLNDRGLEPWARADLRQARGLEPGVTDPALSDGSWSLQLARTLVGVGEWVPQGEVWVRGQPTPADLESAARGDLRALALVCRAREEAGGCQADVMRYWRAALLEGAAVSPDEGLLAYVDLVERGTPTQRTAPELWPIRAASRWENLRQIQGATPHGALRWGEPPDQLSPSRIEDALFPEGWPAEETVTLAAGRSVVRPPSSQPLAVGVRCRTTGEEAPSRCVFEALGARGQTVAQLDVSAWGEAAALHLPPSSGPVYIRCRAARGVVAQLRLPSTLAAPLQEAPRRQVWSLTPGGRARFEILGPTTLHVRTGTGGPSPGGPSPRVFATVTPLGSSPGRELLLEPVAGPDELELAIPTPGPVVVTLRTDRAMLFTAAMRVPSSGGVLSPVTPPAPDGVSLGEVPPAAPEVDLAALPPSVDPSLLRARPLQLPQGTAWAAAAVGGTDALGEDLLDTTPRSRYLLGILHHSAYGALWGEATVGALWTPGEGVILLPRAGMDVHFLHERTHLGVVADLGLAQGVIEGAPQLTGEGTGHADLRWWATPQQQLLASVGLARRQILVGEYDPTLPGAPPPELWSAYKQGHPSALHGEVGARRLLGPWFTATTSAWATTNTRLASEPLDHLGLEGQLWMSLPGVELRATSSVERRLADEDRPLAYWDPELSLAGVWTFWPHADLGIQLYGSLHHQVHFAETSAVLGVRTYLSRDRALMDVRPSRLLSRGAPEWHQDQAADLDLQRSP